MYKLSFKEAEEPETKLPTSVGSQKKQVRYIDRERDRQIIAKSWEEYNTNI